MSSVLGNPDFRDLLVALSDEGARFLVVGGWALALRGHGRGTDDMDLFAQAAGENAVKAFRALAPCSARRLVSPNARSRQGTAGSSRMRPGPNPLVL
jgi:hypothetical protein